MKMKRRRRRQARMRKRTVRRPMNKRKMRKEARSRAWDQAPMSNSTSRTSRRTMMNNIRRLESNPRNAPNDHPYIPHHIHISRLFSHVQHPITI
jgi:hypothetical protein